MGAPLSFARAFHRVGAARDLCCRLTAIFVIYYPALYFLDKPDPLGMPPFAPFVAPLVGAGLLLASLAFWRFGLRHYTGTGT
jgi:ABC-2 type transport system permease protein